MQALLEVVPQKKVTAEPSFRRSTAGGLIYFAWT